MQNKNILFAATLCVLSFCSPRGNCDFQKGPLKSTKVSQLPLDCLYATHINNTEPAPSKQQGIAVFRLHKLLQRKICCVFFVCLF